MKRLILLAVFIALVWAGLSLWQSPWFALYQIDRGIEERDPVRVERYVDLEALVKGAAAVTGALASEQLGTSGTDVGSRLLDAFVGAVAKGVGEAAAIEGAMEVRRAIQAGRMTRSLGPFEVNRGLSAFGSSQTFDETAIVELKGTCHGTEASIRVLFEEKDGGGLQTFGVPTFGYPKKWVLTGVDEDSVKQLAKQCRAGAAASQT